jgi:hypothetical protein
MKVERIHTSVYFKPVDEEPHDYFIGFNVCSSSLLYKDILLCLR